jgi:hypothetical protein
MRATVQNALLREDVFVSQKNKAGEIAGKTGTATNADGDI